VACTQNRPFAVVGLHALFDLRGLAKAVTQVVQLGPADLAAADCLDLDDVGSVQGEHLLAAYAVAQAADGEALFDAAVLLRNDGALENLDSLAGAFLDFDVYTNRVADPNDGQLFLHVLTGQSLHEIHIFVLLVDLGVHNTRNAAALSRRLCQRTTPFFQAD
jgi:hypothetical protein